MHLHSKNVVLVKVAWQGTTDKEMTWELKKVMREKYPQMFETQGKS